MSAADAQDAVFTGICGAAACADQIRSVLRVAAGVVVPRVSLM